MKYAKYCNLGRQVDAISTMDNWVCCHVKTDIWARNSEMQTKIWCPIQGALKYYEKAFAHKLALPIFKKLEEEGLGRF